MLADRIRKRFRHLGRWARRQGIGCFRLYDRDIPEHPLQVDFYEGRAAVYAMQRTIDTDDRARRAWLDLVTGEVAEGLEISRHEVFLRDRRRLKGSDQYARRAHVGQEFPVKEGGYFFLVNLTDYHDTGLFLDHRITRKMVEQESSGRRMLNLFCYTGAFTVYAAGGGAHSSVSVDLSRTYVDWAGRNFDRNRMPGELHQTEQADVLEWLVQARRERKNFDMIVCDPPTFSNSKRMEAVFDVQRDHPELIRGCLSLLTPSGSLYFSSNRKGFELDRSGLGSSSVEDLTSVTIPEDYRGLQPHRSFRIRPS